MGKLISKVQEKRKKAVKSHVRFWLGVWKAQASLTGIM